MKKLQQNIIAIPDWKSVAQFGQKLQNVCMHLQHYIELSNKKMVLIKINCIFLVKTSR